MGASPTELLGENIRKRWPSALTSKRCPSKKKSDIGNNSCGTPALTVAPRFTSTAIIFRSADMKNSSLPSRRHLGCTPPLTEICHFPTFGGIAWMYTLARPESLDENARYLPSGKMRAWTCEYNIADLASESMSALYGTTVNGNDASVCSQMSATRPLLPPSPRISKVRLSTGASRCFRSILRRPMSLVAS